MAKKKLVEVWVCADDVKNPCVVIYPSSNKLPYITEGLWDAPGSNTYLKDITRTHFIRTYGKENTPPVGKKWLMDIEL